MAMNGKDDKKPPKPLFTDEELKIIQPFLDQKPPIEEIPIGMLKVDMSYQDRPRDKIVRQVVDHFSEAWLGIFWVSRRPDGTRYLMDGVSRQTGLVQRGDHQYPARCLVFDTEGRKVEALVFAFLNSFRSKDPIKIENVYQAQYIAGTDGGFGAAVEQCGFKFLRGVRQLRGPRYCKTAWDLDCDGGAMRKALYTIKDCWRDRYPVYGYMVLGVALLYHKYARRAIDDQVRNVLKRMSPDQIMEKVNKRYAKIGVKARLHPDDKPELVSRVLVDIINLHPGKTGKLDVSKLQEGPQLGA